MSVADKLTTIAENEQRVYDAGNSAGYGKGYSEGAGFGYSAGHDAGYQEGYEAGQNEVSGDYGEGYTAGYDDGYSQGSSEGYGYGYQHGQDEAYPRGYEEGHAAGASEGQKTGRDAIWDRIQQGGMATYSPYIGYFNGNVYGFSNFYPVHDVRPVGNAQQLFYAWENKRNDHAGSLAQRFKDCGVVLDTSQATDLSSAFAYGHFTELPTIDCTGLTTTSSGLFSWCHSRLKTIERIIVNETQVFSSWFANTNVENVLFNGVIGQSLNMSYCTRLSVDSMKSIISCLKNYSGTDSEFSYTLTFPEGRWAALEADSTAPDGSTWEEYVTNTLGWNV